VAVSNAGISQHKRTEYTVEKSSKARRTTDEQTQAPLRHENKNRGEKPTLEEKPKENMKKGTGEESVGGTKKSWRSKKSNCTDMSCGSLQGSRESARHMCSKEKKQGDMQKTCDRAQTSEPT